MIIGYSFKREFKRYKKYENLKFIQKFKKKIRFVDIFDPIVDTKEIYKEHRIKVQSKINKKNFYDALVLAVPHEKIIKDGKNKILKYLKKDAYIVDIKKVL